jgi:hypothetical protein
MRLPDAGEGAWLKVRSLDGSGTCSVKAAFVGKGEAFLSAQQKVILSLRRMESLRWTRK